MNTDAERNFCAALIKVSLIYGRVARLIVLCGPVIVPLNNAVNAIYSVKVYYARSICGSRDISANIL